MPEQSHSESTSHHDGNGGFRNPWPSSELPGFREFLRWRATYARRPDSTAYGSLPLTPPSFAAPRAEKLQLSLTWVGHSTFLMQLAGLNVLTDPMWSRRCSPVQFAGPPRRMPPGIRFDDLPPIDLVVQSHDHYDHLDAQTVRRLARAQPQARWIAPLRLGRWLTERGVGQVTELDWWQSTTVGPVTVTSAPAQHFSGRTFRRNRTLWCGWVLKAPDHSVYFVGDTGYFSDIGMVGSHLGPFDAILAPIGAYDPRWFMKPVHLDPEEAVQVYRDVTESHGRDSTILTAMHWGTFKLTAEPLGEPPGRLTAAWKEAGLPLDRLWIPIHGETRWWG